MRLVAATEEMDGTAADGWRAVIVDGVRECGRFPFRNGVYLYGPVTRYSPRLFGRFFHFTNAPRRVATARRLCQPFLRQGLRVLIERVRPDVIVSAHPFFNQMTPLALGDTGVRVPIISVVTDLFSVHHAWVSGGVDAWVVPTAAARRFVLAGGVAERDIHLLGLPIDPSFATKVDASMATRPERRAALGLDPSLPLVLLVGGGEGVGGLGAVAHALAGVDLPAQLVIVTGRNRALLAELRALRSAFRMPVTVLGFATNMPQLMRAADVLVTKAGSLTVAEALASELPLLLMGAVPGQEEGNVDFVRGHDLGLFTPTPEQIVAHLHLLLQPDGADLARMRANARRLRQPRAAFDIARLVFAYLPPPAVPSVWEGLPPRAALAMHASPARSLVEVGSA
jgi:1,2-diacylglycerol 3-beta-galactosyltransferase